VFNSALFYQQCFAEDKNAILGFECGPHGFDFGERPIAVLPRGSNTSTGSLLSFWLWGGLKMGDFGLYANIANAGSAIKIDSVNGAGYLLFSIDAAFKSISWERLNLYFSSGYQYLYFEAYYTGNDDIVYEDKNRGATLGISPRLMVKKTDENLFPQSAIEFGDNIYLCLSAKYSFFNPPVKDYSISVGSCFKQKDLFIKIRYIDQKDIFKLYALTIGGYWYYSL
jgi:hypothetical protein